MPLPPPPPAPQSEIEQRAALVEPYVPEPLPHPRVRRRLFPRGDEEEVPPPPPPPPPRHRAYERARRAPLEEVKSRRNTVAEEQTQRDEKIREISEHVDRLGRRLEDLKRLVAMGPEVQLKWKMLL
ncbi:UNVERIFIED_CONTAM: hypothetical protein Slati_0926700 [Sesamum latifolium]|uniref:Uncharacterized protein n=1 Tax=Sesamum latifolium TaxID=2727402 RepID=A0AAW2XPA1_9LAMI